MHIFSLLRYVAAIVFHAGWYIMSPTEENGGGGSCQFLGMKLSLSIVCPSAKNHSLFHVGA